MEIWHYDPTTGLLLGAGTADPSPVEPGAWLIPAFAVTVAPPAPQQGQEVAWDGAAWVQRPAPPPRTPTAADARARRNAALVASDWTQIPDAPLSPAQRQAWAAYRAALRDVPAQPGFPVITWPEAPA